ncbi:MurR/RpiR family transcriptional regulator [Orrella marina]|uniref:RpiR family transcriptional regulator n=1 Tax=Orrella marina TaxID=2163011 RepID=A0A2R4XPS2_9BURK|nr:MurR/RpiR family transcriptional regulator [Orrella marina]AWB35806.1 RpiR family transcriptional regulator [Orrella marina]
MTKLAANAEPPRTLQSLRELVVRIGRAESPISLGVKARNVLARLVEQPEEVATRSITDLAVRLDVNASTLSRLARSLGYTGFAEFQGVFRATVTQSHQRFYSEQGQRLIGQQIPEDDYLGVAVQLASESIRNVDAFLSRLDATELRGAVTLLASAPRVRLFGVRQIHSVVTLLCYGLGLVRRDVSMLDGPGRGIAESLAQMRKGDALVVSSVSPYSRRVGEVSRVAAQAGIHVIAVTDSLASPLATHARYSFLISHESSYISNSMGAYVVFCESLVNLVARELGPKALEALERHEHFIEALNIEMR